MEVALKEGPGNNFGSKIVIPCGADIRCSTIYSSCLDWVKSSYTYQQSLASRN